VKYERGFNSLCVRKKRNRNRLLDKREEAGRGSARGSWRFGYVLGFIARPVHKVSGPGLTQD